MPTEAEKKRMQEKFVSRAGEMIIRPATEAEKKAVEQALKRVVDRQQKEK